MNLILGKVLVIFLYLFVFISSFIPFFLYSYSFITFYFPFSYSCFYTVQLSRDSNYFFPIFNTSLLISFFTILSLMRSSIYFFSFLQSISEHSSSERIKLLSIIPLYSWLYFFTL